jgi:hypothetical protein
MPRRRANHRTPDPVPTPPANLADVPVDPAPPAAPPAPLTPGARIRAALSRARDAVVRALTADIVLRAGDPGDLKPRALDEVVALARFTVEHPTPLSRTVTGRLALALSRDVLAVASRLIHARSAAVRMGTILDAAVTVDERPDAGNLARLRKALNGEAADAVGSDESIAALTRALDAARAASRRRGLPVE